MRLSSLSNVLIAFMICTGGLAGARETEPLPQASPQSVGLSAERLERMAGHFEQQSAAAAAAGYVLMVARDGRLVFSRAIGHRDMERQVPMSLDTRFRIASMTKPVTAVAVLMLIEEGRIQLDDPVARYLPEFANSRVYTGTDAQGNLLTEPAKRNISIRDLLTHASGLGYARFFDTQSPLGKAYGALPLDAHDSLAEVVRRIAGVPLYFHPGEGWRYSYAYDVLGRLVEAVSGTPFAQFLNQRLFMPLKMTSTGFSLPASELPLLATVYRHAAAGGLEPSKAMLGDPTDVARWPSGGGGLISTAGDYLRFAQMLANGGSLEGRQYLSPVTVSLMTQDQVPEDALFKYWGSNSLGLGYGLGVAMQMDVRHAPYLGFVGDYAWGGALDTHWLVSPKTGLVAVLLTQIDPSGNKEPQRTDTDFRDLLFAAVTAGRGID